jgi:hypothetical protein
VRGKKPELLGNSTINFWKRQHDVQSGTGNEKRGCTNGCISQRPDDSGAAGRFLWRRRLNMNLRDGLADWHSLLPIA